VWSFIFLFFFIGFFSDLGAFYRLMPLMANFFLLGLEAVLFVPLFIYKKKANKASHKEKFPLKTFLVALLILLGAFILIEVTGLGKDPVWVSTISLGAPLLEGQIWYISGLLALLASTAYAWSLIPSNAQFNQTGRSDLVIFIILWLAAVILWMSLPLPNHNYFAPAVQPPNFEKYPFSDAEQYAYNSLYVYYGSLEDFVVSKPLYVSLLTIFHWIGGLSYINLVLLQTLVVGLFPPMLYLIGREVHSRFGGISIALFAIFREVTAIQASSMANVSNTKLLLSDMPAALLVSLLALVLIRWFKESNNKLSGREFLIGGLIGALILIRIQTMALAPFAVILIVIRYFPRIKHILASAAILLLALALVVTPVLLRNHSITGVYWVDSPSSSQRLYTKFLDAADYENAELEAETREEVLQRNINVISTAFVKGFGSIMQFTMDHFLRNGISSILVMPVRLGNGTSFLDYLRINQPFWAEVYSHSNWLNSAIVIVNLTLIALGFSKVFGRNPKSVIAVLGLYTVYSLSSAVVRLSGWRFILPVDWIIYTFYALGLVEVLLWLFRHTVHRDLRTEAGWIAEYPALVPSIRRPRSFYAAFGLLFFFIGVFIPAREVLLPSYVPKDSKTKICERIENALTQNGYDEFRNDFISFCSSDETRVLSGFSIYPRYFKSGEGFYQRTYDPWFGEQDYARLVFRLIATQNTKVYIKTDTENLKIPNGALVYLAGRETTKFGAQFVLVDSEEPQLIISSALLSGEETLTPIE
ncbi:MAG TPA: hypothetical protein VMW28_04405, partial [Pelolinea sp.]|nr:hypothetical protein [Pelolinea sp.]